MPAADSKIKKNLSLKFEILPLDFFPETVGSM